MSESFRRARMSRCDQLIEALGLEILGRRIEIGEKLPTPDELGERYALSRPIVREAIKSLGAKGLVESRTRVGTIVSRRERWNLLDSDVLDWFYRTADPREFFRVLFEVRMAVEPTVASMAAQKRTESELAAIHQALEKMESADMESESAIAADLAFHRAILAACRNELLAQMGSLIGIGLSRSFQMSTASYKMSMPLHRPVYEAIAKHNPGEAASAMTHMLNQTLEFINNDVARTS